MAHVDLHKINDLLQKIQHEDSSDLAQAKATGKDHKLRSGRYHDMAQQDTEGMSDGDMVDVIANLYYRLDKVHALESVKEEECSACGGTGWDRSVTSDEDDRGCDECGGTGEVDENIKEDEASDLYHDNVKSGKDYNDYKGIQIHNLRKELKQVRKTLLNLQDIEGKDNSSDMVNDIRNMLGGYEKMVDNMESAFDKLQIGRHRKESSEFKKRVEEEEWGAEHFQQADAANMKHAKEKLEKLIRELDVFILWRGHNSGRFFNNGDRAGTGHLESIVDKLQDINKNWDKDTELYGM